MYHRICHGALQRPGGTRPGLIMVMNIIFLKSLCSASSLIFTRDSIRANHWNKIKKNITCLGSGVHKAVNDTSLVLTS